MPWKWDGYPQQEVSGFLFFLSFTVFPSFSAFSLHSVVFPIFISSLFLGLKSVFLFLIYRVCGILLNALHDPVTILINYPEMQSIST